MIGDITDWMKISERILELEEATKNNAGLNFQIALNYGSRDEMIRAIRKIAKDCVMEKLDPEEIKKNVFLSLSGYKRNSGPGFDDPYQWRA